MMPVALFAFACQQIAGKRSEAMHHSAGRLFRDALQRFVDVDSTERVSNKKRAADGPPAEDKVGGDDEFGAYIDPGEAGR